MEAHSTELHSTAPATRLLSIWPFHLGFRLAFQIAPRPSARSLPASEAFSRHLSHSAYSQPTNFLSHSPQSSPPAPPSAPPNSPCSFGLLPQITLSPSVPCPRSSPPSPTDSNSWSLLTNSGTVMPRRQRMRCRRGGSGRGDDSRGAGSRPTSHLSLANNTAQFHFSSAINHPLITATISISFQEEMQEGGASSSRKRRKFTISDHPPPDTRKKVALPVKAGTKSSSGDDVSSSSEGASDSSSSSGREKAKLHTASDSYSASGSPSKVAEEDVDDYSCPIVEENPPPLADS